jgi:hypothetical protein
MALEGQGHMATIDTMTEALYKRVQAMGGNFPTDDEIESAVGGKDYVKVSDELTQAIEDGGLVIGGGSGGGGDIEVIKINNVATAPAFADAKWSDMTYDEFKSTVTAGDKMYMMMGVVSDRIISLLPFFFFADRLSWTTPTLMIPNTTNPKRLQANAVWLEASADADGMTELKTNTGNWELDAI